MKMHQQKGNGPNRQNQFVIEEEGNMSQKSSDEESYSMGRSAGGHAASGAK